MVFFALRPALVEDSWRVALFTGAFFGFITYATYDLTNLATVKNWPLTVTIVDLLWGTILGASVSMGTFFYFALPELELMRVKSMKSFRLKSCRSNSCNACITYDMICL